MYTLHTESEVHSLKAEFNICHDQEDCQLWPTTTNVRQPEQTTEAERETQSLFAFTALGEDNGNVSTEDTTKGQLLHYTKMFSWERYTVGECIYWHGQLGKAKIYLSQFEKCFIWNGSLFITAGSAIINHRTSKTQLNHFQLTLHFSKFGWPFQ